MPSVQHYIIEKKWKLPFILNRDNLMKKKHNSISKKVF